MQPLTVVGTISGTSADGIDLAVIDTDGIAVARQGPAMTVPYRAATRQAVLEAIAAGPSDRSRWDEIGRAVGDDHAEALGAFVAAHGLRPDLVVFHGQTVWHDPDGGETVQLGDPQHVADAIDLPVIGDLRKADMAAGGQGAPLVPVYHRALAAGLDAPLCFLNIGGVANLTYIDGDAILAFDVGPGNALLDDWIRRHGLDDCDRDGRWSAAGVAELAHVEIALTHPFFARPAPKSLDRNAFSLKLVDGMSPEDGAATLAALTAEAVARAVALLPADPLLWVVCGGGRRNPTVMRELSERLTGRVAPADDYDLDGDALEAQAMAFLGARFMAGLPTSYPQTTGAREPVIGGRLFRPSRR
ncbi:anhydro-N-acetylmuramic acid kinase [Polymorphum gilvum]|uniref:Anhydro-N-acetylmuramic acid kinase n=1 Tax=Polymorphum gilvum (strain LMG 25793 / CGMCC 1.9160 / SL003B-26A1) TaxID=991905 RepID=F2J1V0_POLGS|nr:anhydro-N-acetylmuramic acid kinase [Polymorphum gilvum]ADZ72011.1 Anhydro-N-acetylmuramic acid kinase [Polymorphum gilvum SL003B-26A1]